MKDWSKELKPHPDANGAEILRHERQRSTVDVEGLSRHLFGDEYLSRQARITAILSREKVFDKTQQGNLSRPDRYVLGLARGKRMRQLMDEHKWNDDDLLMAEYLIDDILPYHLHISLFQAAMREQCSAEQAAYWLPLIEKWQIIGAYAQTELGHGSNVRGIECEARWDQETKEFVIHSPTLTASKWWNGTLGRTATHAVVVAQLMIPVKGQPGKYESKGPRPFIVQIRDSKTHIPFPSIIVGDINAKYGYASMDNAYCLFRHHRVPHSALLSRYAQVNPNTGEYTRPKNAASVYGQLTRGRSVIVMNARLVIARAVTVAVRYLSIRRQFRDTDDDAAPTSLSPRAETPVLDYTTVQIRILPLLATFFALHYSGTAMRSLYERARGQLDKGQPAQDSDAAALAELHSTSAGLKSLATDLAANSVEICRRAMGGHGFGGGTGLIQLNNDYLSKPTVEGDNWMITQQVARFLIKTVKELVEDKREAKSATERNLKTFLDKRTGDQSNTPEFNILAEDETGDEAIVRVFAWRASWAAYQAYEAREVKKRPWNSLLIQLHGLSKAYSESLLVSNFHAALTAASNTHNRAPASTTVNANANANANANVKVSPAPPPPTSNLLPHLQTLYRLFALHTISLSPLDFLSSHAIPSLTTIHALPDTILGLMSQIRPHAVRLVDGLAIPDFLLDSALGRSDGKVYEDLWRRAHVVNPLNDLVVNPWYWERELVKNTKSKRDGNGNGRRIPSSGVEPGGSGGGGGGGGGGGVGVGWEEILAKL